MNRRGENDEYISFLDSDIKVEKFSRENDSGNSGSSQIHNVVHDLLDIKKGTLNTLWEDINESWIHRKNFVHSNFRKDATDSNYESISLETMRVYKIRWLMLRITGLIEQREGSLKKMREIMKRNRKKPEDPVKLKKEIRSEIDSLRSVSVYLIEYVEKWRELQNAPNKTFNWEEHEDYLEKMNKDSRKIINSFPQLKQIIKLFQLDTESPLLLPSVQNSNQTTRKKRLSLASRKNRNIESRSKQLERKNSMGDQVSFLTENQSNSAREANESNHLQMDAELQNKLKIQNFEKLREQEDMSPAQARHLEKDITAGRKYLTPRGKELLSEMEHTARSSREHPSLSKKSQGWKSVETMMQRKRNPTSGPLLHVTREDKKGNPLALIDRQVLNQVDTDLTYTDRILTSAMHNKSHQSHAQDEYANEIINENQPKEITTEAEWSATKSHLSDIERLYLAEKTILKAVK
eukprot:gb/GECH01013479.1/.p1 GENE.gb/GECH01013479.1/~~gb/GECH01013479.1/.p1  ORF type:complete len:464 (+),score=127.11 gb/GECH01013479.1/:1-1392(+)